jgi:hypothetical protein
MSTKAIRSFIETTLRHYDLETATGRAAYDAKVELEEIVRAAKEVVRECALEQWTSSMPTALADAIRRIEAIAKEAP